LDTASYARSLEPLDLLAQKVGRACEAAPVPLLVLRIAELERIAWRSGKSAARRLERRAVAAFERCAARVLRSGDAAAHDSGSDVFAIALIAPSRAQRTTPPVDCRAVLERMAAAISLHVEVIPETGWTLVSRLHSAHGIAPEIGAALERGERDRERYEFFAAIGHELRTPLTSIRGYLETLLEEPLDPRLAQQFLKTARSEALRMGRMLDGMFEFSLLDLSVRGLVGASCDLEEQAERAMHIVRPSAASRRVTVRCEMSGGGRVALETDACLQMLTNLLENAIKHGREGGVVVLHSRRTAEGIAIAVDDDGDGIRISERESIFALRRRGAAAERRPGHGIGLAIVKMIVERAGGRIGVSDSVLGGARFEVLLAAQAEPPAAS
jgi:signal transduction histidine kinase